MEASQRLEPSRVLGLAQRVVRAVSLRSVEHLYVQYGD
ncbi:MAG: hypothetical protein AVDCRST_MAG77-907 [uncultured Chloroflexi bacterium]|uniref:Uncharacterized protein n=1 Tax=uncultured Chloroflexota bacterium TaxID=166587 RepID=A0A6J4HQI4_9CHLR|nr:MAG: hypothetical protein AVDCRST_MAG77-907 [uncultured Chloroflexota bacterium]